jgi:hypothetical protein
MNETTADELPLGHRISWEPAKPGGGGAGRPLVVESADRLAYRAGWPMLALLWLIFLLGFVPMCGWIISRSAFGSDFDSLFDGGLSALVFYAALMLLGAGSLALFCKPHVFDKQRGWYWHSWLAPQQTRRPRDGHRAIRLELIQALQLLSYERKVEFHTAKFHEINLILVDGSRVNVRCHVYGEQMKSEARTLSVFVGVPILERP